MFKVQGVTFLWPAQCVVVQDPSGDGGKEKQWKGGKTLLFSLPGSSSKRQSTNAAEIEIGDGL